MDTVYLNTLSYILYIMMSLISSFLTWILLNDVLDRYEIRNPGEIFTFTIMHLIHNSSDFELLTNYQILVKEKNEVTVNSP